jgi:hypothetical protein
MAKRVPPDEKPYRPVDDALVRSVLNPQPMLSDEDQESDSEESPTAQTRPAAESSTPKVLTLPRRKSEPEEERERKPEPERFTREKRFLLTPSEDKQLDRLVADVAEHLGTAIKPSHMIRAMTTLLCHASDELIKQSRRVGPIKRPPNGDTTALAAFEHYLSQLIETAVRNSKPLK